MSALRDLPSVRSEIEATARLRDSSGDPSLRRVGHVLRVVLALLEGAAGDVFEPAAAALRHSILSNRVRRCVSRVFWLSTGPARVQSQPPPIAAGSPPDPIGTREYLDVVGGRWRATRPLEARYGPWLRVAVRH